MNVDIPDDLLRPPPRPLPVWARRRTYAILLFVAAGTCFFAGVVELAQAGVAALIPTGIGTVIAVLGVLHRRKRRILTEGDGVAVGFVTETGTSKGMWWCSYEFDAPGGDRRGTASQPGSELVRSFGFRPEAGDLVFVVYDSKDPLRNAAWGFALPSGQVRPVHWSDRPMPRWLSLVVVAVAILVAAAVTVRAVLALRQ